MPTRDNQDVGREERIKEARRRAAERAPQRETENQERATRLHRSVTSLGPDEAQRRVSLAEQADEAEYIGPLKTPKEWAIAVEIAREITIEAARRRTTITYGEIRLAVSQELELLVGHSMFADLVMNTNRKADGVLLSSIIVHKDDGNPGSGFLPYARTQGFDDSVGTLQSQVWKWAADQLRR